MFVVLITESSVAKPWVVTEIDAAVVRKINEQTRLIPIIIDDTPVPVSLESMVMNRISARRRSFGSVTSASFSNSCSKSRNSRRAACPTALCP